MKSEIQTLLRAYADRMRRQADTVEKIAGALADVADSDERFRQRLQEVMWPRPQRHPQPRPVPPIQPYPHGHHASDRPPQQRPLSDLFRSLDELTETELDYMRRSVP